MKKCCRILVLLVFCFGLFYSNLNGQPFSLDTTFQLQYDFVNGNIVVGTVSGIKQYNNGALLVYGDFEPWALPGQYRIVKFLPNGQLDLNFQISPLVDPGGAGVFYMHDISNGFLLNQGSDDLHKIDSAGNEIEIQWYDTLRSQFSPRSNAYPFLYPDGGMFFPCFQCRSPAVNPQYFFNLARVSSSGHYDTTFTHDVSGGGIFKTLEYDSKTLLLIGWFSHYDTTMTPVVCKTDTSGNIDTTWTSVFSHGFATDAVVQGDGKILIMGNLFLSGSSDSIAIVRLNSNGTLDSTFNNFNNAKKYLTNISTACQTTDGGYLFGGGFFEYQGYPRINIVKTDFNGFIDTLYFSGIGVDSLDTISTNLGFPSGVTYIEKSIHGDAYYVMGTFLKYGTQTVQPIIRIHGLTVGIEEFNDYNPLAVYPNPAINLLHFNTVSFKNEITISIFDVYGKKIKEEKQKVGYKVEASFSLQGLSAGLYFLRVIDEKHIATAKVIIQK